METQAMITAVVSIIVAVFGSTGFWSWLSSKKSKNKEILEGVTELKSNVGALSNRVTSLERHNREQDMTNVRTRIIEMSDGIRNGKKYSKDRYDSILIDIDNYERFCAENPNYKNSVTGFSIEKIKDHYKQEDFL